MTVNTVACVHVLGEFKTNIKSLFSNNKRLANGQLMSTCLKEIDLSYNILKFWDILCLYLLLLNFLTFLSVYLCLTSKSILDNKID